MTSVPNLTVMLTHHDLTVPNAYEIFDRCKHTPAEYWGFKEEPLPRSEMKKLYAYMKQCGKKTVLEVICYTEAEALAGAETAVECGCDFLMGTLFFDSVNDFCKAHHLRYLPFVGQVSERPSVLSGEIDDIITEARSYLQKGAYGIDLLGYRYTADADALIERFVKKITAPVCLAGSINSFARLDTVKRIAPWSFTIGSAFFEHAFGSDIPAQIETVVQYINQPSLLSAGAGR